MAKKSNFFGYSKQQQTTNCLSTPLTSVAPHPPPACSEAHSCQLGAVLCVFFPFVPFFIKKNNQLIHFPKPKNDPGLEWFVSADPLGGGSPVGSGWREKGTDWAPPPVDGQKCGNVFFGGRFYAPRDGCYRFGAGDVQVAQSAFFP